MVHRSPTSPKPPPMTPCPRHHRSSLFQRAHHHQSSHVVSLRPVQPPKSAPRSIGKVLYPSPTGPSPPADRIWPGSHRRCHGAKLLYSWPWALGLARLVRRRHGAKLLYSWPWALGLARLVGLAWWAWPKYTMSFPIFHSD
jgi:hypothetical protein